MNGSIFSILMVSLLLLVACSGGTNMNDEDDYNGMLSPGTEMEIVNSNLPCHWERMMLVYSDEPFDTTINALECVNGDVWNLESNRFNEKGESEWHRAKKVHDHDGRFDESLQPKAFPQDGGRSK